MRRYPSVRGVVLLISALAAAGQQPSAESVSLQDVRLIDGTGRAAMDHIDILIEDGKIAAILKHGQQPERAAGRVRVVNLSGKTVIPGLINGHGHLGLVENATVSPAHYTAENVERQLAQYARYGVTTMMSLGMNKDLLYDLRAKQNSRENGEATLLTADRGIGSPNGMPPVKVGPDQLYRAGTPEEARKDVDEMAERRPDLVKVWVDDNLGKLPKQRPEVYGAVIDEAHKRHLRVAAHLFYQADAKQLLNDGVDVIAHSIRDSQVDDTTVKLIKSKGVFYIPTLQLEESFYVYADQPSLIETQFFERAAGPALLKEIKSPQYREKVMSDKTTPIHKQALQTACLNLKRLHDAGVAVAFGTDSGANPYRIQGWAEHRELELMVKAGITPLEALHSATEVTAQMLHIDGKTGTVAKGKQADLVVLNGDPSQDITNTRKISLVFVRGRQVSFPNDSGHDQ